MSTLEEPSRPHQARYAGPLMVLAVASAGWVFDVYEGQLFTVFKSAMFAELTGVLPPRSNGRATSGSPYSCSECFGWSRFRRSQRPVRTRADDGRDHSGLSGLLVAHAGRSRMLQVQVLRFLVGALGTGGEWAIAAALVAETFPAQSRARASGIFHASSVIGTALASVTGMFLSVSPGRWGFSARPGSRCTLTLIRVAIQNSAQVAGRAARAHLRSNRNVPGRHPPRAIRLRALAVAGLRSWA